MNKKLLRKGLSLPLFLLPTERRIAAERWVRGQKECSRLRRADSVVVSFGKSGRTWLRVMVSRFYQQRHKLPESSLLKFENFQEMNDAIPRILFTHDNYVKDFTKHFDSKVDFYDHRVVLLARHPGDIAVSQYFQWKHRMKEVKKLINKYPTGDADVSMFDFVRSPNCGVPKIVEFLNLWEREIPKTRAGLIIRYEDLKSDPESTMHEVMAFFGTPGSSEEIREVVEYGAYENMKKLESSKAYGQSGRMLPGDRNNPDSYKVRRAKVGGYRDYFDADQVAWLDEFIRSQLASSFGYSDVEPLTAAASGRG